MILAADKLNPQSAARLVPPLGRWRRFEPKRSAMMKAELERIVATPGLSKDAQLTAANKINELYVFVLANKKTDYAGSQTLDRHTDILRQALLDQLKDSDATEPEKVTINGNEGRRYRISGVRDGVKLAYFMTIVETADHFHHIWAWTEGSRADENGPILNRIADSYRINP